MMTPPDGRPDGNHDILDHEAQNLRPDETRLLKFIQAHRNDRDHGFKEFQTSGLLPQVKFFDEELPTHGGADREALIEKCLAYFANQQIISFDPDNGLEVGNNNGQRVGATYSRAASRKYVYMNELQKFFKDKKSLMIYQHKPRFQLLDPVIKGKEALLRKYFPEENIFFVHHTRVFFIFVVQPHHQDINYQLFESP
jgi:hypothetical protein